MVEVILKEDQITGALDRVAAALTDLSPVMQDFGEYLITSTKARFPTGKAPDGSTWAAKALSTLLKSSDTRPLFGPTGVLSSQIIAVSGPDSVEVGSNLIYAAVMQFGAAKGAFGTTGNGSAIPWGNIPARPFLGISDADEVALLEILQEYLEEAAANAG